MKNTLVVLGVSLLSFLAALGYTRKAKEELCEIETKKPIPHQNEPQEQYPSEPEAIGGLSEPEDVKYSGALERIKMLRQHLQYRPSAEWIGGVIDSAEREIESLQNAQ